jgi:hypothetical protein
MNAEFRLGWFLFAFVGCSDPPSCQQALTHYYDAGCSYRNLQTGDRISPSEMIALCQGIAANASEACEDRLDDWLVCNNEATANSCDCSTSQMALLTCQ